MRSRGSRAWLLGLLVACCACGSIASGSSETAEEVQIREITAWLTSNGAVLNGSAIHDFGSTYGFGLLATRDIEVGTAVVDIPAALFISCTPAVAQLIPQTFVGFEDWCLAIRLLQEKSKPDSFWAPYIRMLPSKSSTVFFMSEEDVAGIPSPNTQHVARAMATDVRRLHAEVVAPKAAEFGIGPALATEEALRWACAMVSSRKYAAGLVPGLDFANSHPEGEGFAGLFKGKHPNQEILRARLVSVRPRKAGAQLFARYDAMTGAELLANFGFVAGVEQDFVPVAVVTEVVMDPAARGKPPPFPASASPSLGAHPACAERLAILYDPSPATRRALASRPELTVAPYALAHKTFPEQLMAHAVAHQYRCSGALDAERRDAEAEKRKRMMYAPADMLLYTLFRMDATTFEHEYRALLWLRAALAALRAAQLPGPAEEERGALQRETDGVRRGLAAARLNRKLIFDSALDSIQDVMTSILGSREDPAPPPSSGAQAVSS